MSTTSTRRKHYLLNESTPFAIREAFNHLRINLNYATGGAEGCPVYAITSSSEEIGKSTIISNLAISFSQTGKRVLLIDGDMRLPVQAEAFDLKKNSTGLSEILSGILSDPMQAPQNTAYENLQLLASGRIPPNPSELLESANFEKMIEIFRKQYDIILIDFPPVDVVADALAMSKCITGYLLAVRSGRSDSRKVRRAVETVKSVDAKLLGVVLNAVNPKGRGAKRYYNYYSRYGK